MIYPNLKAELARKGWTIRMLSTVADIPLSTLTAKIYGKSELKWSEAKKIKHALGIDMPLEKLFMEKGEVA